MKQSDIISASSYNLESINQIIMKIIKLYEEIDLKGTLNSSIYDTAYVASILVNKKPLFPDAINWIINSQNEDGSWGSGRIKFNLILSTLAAINILIENEYNSNVTKGLIWIDQCLKDKSVITNSVHNGAGYSLILTNLIKKIQNKGYLQDSFYSMMINQRSKKMESFPISMVLNKKTHFTFMIESLEIEIDEKFEIDHLISNNGALGCSIASTAWYLSKSNCSNDLSISYLKSMQNPDFGWPSFGDLKIMTIIFTLYPLYKSIGFIPKIYNPQLNYLKNCWTDKGVGFSEYFVGTDGDDTSLGLLLLLKSGFICHKDEIFNSIFHFEKEEYFETYLKRLNKSSSRTFELGNNIQPPISVNLHVLDLFLNARDHEKSKSVIQKIMRLFDNYFKKNDFLPSDHWHTSPAYNNLTGVLVFTSINKKLAKKCLDYFLNSQNKDGLWGTSESMIEITSFAVQAITYYHKKISNIDLSILNSAIPFLLNHLDLNIYENPIEPMWIDKVLSSPTEIIKSGIYSGVLSYYSCFGYKDFINQSLDKI